MTAVAVCVVASLSACTAPMPIQPEPAGPVVKITASQFHFTPNRITLLKGQAVTLELTSDDVTHGFMIRQLKIDADIKPGKLTHINVTPDVTGTFKAICDHYCGFGHGDMRMTIVVQEPRSQSASAENLRNNELP
ncbi:MAG TPA: cupredoxin domain-containing protein [Candidatus Binataceae bacterium]|nr:cupredoxin domain-containing protein [Candidatus Binataceae bacterium]